MHCFAHCRIAADAGVDAAEVHLANKKNCINFIKFEMSSNCRALPAKCIHIQTNIFIYACGCVCVAEHVYVRVVCVCGFTSAMTSSGGARLKAVVVAIASRFRFSWLRFCPCHCFCFWLCLCHCRWPCSVCSNIKNCAPKSPK